ncbi:MAG: peptide deformylase [Alphaproteobacteria bacterium]
MSLLPIIFAPDPRLKLHSEPVGTVGDETRQLMDDMLETMHAAPGIGLSAVQVGVTKRIIVLDVAVDEGESRLLRLIDPEITWLSSETEIFDEGCLSFPDHFGEIIRPSAVKARFTDENNQPVEIDASGLLARCIQHEMDHLDGVLMVDHLSALRRGMILRKLTKLRKAENLKSA